MSFIIVQCTMENVKRTQFIIKITTENLIWYIVKSLLEFSFKQMASSNTQSCNESDFYKIFIFENIITGWPAGFQNIAFFNKIPSNLLNVMVKSVSINNKLGRKQIFEKKNFSFSKKNFFFRNSRDIRGIP